MNAITEEGNGLRHRLAALEADQQRNLVANRKVNYGLVKRSDFVDRNPRLVDVPSRVSYDSIKDTIKVKKETRERLKEEKEMNECTFRPQLNKNTEALLSSYVSVMERPMPRKEIQTTGSSRMELEGSLSERQEAELLNPTERKSPNLNFYQQKMEWKSAVEEAKLRERLQKEEQDQQKPVGKPVVNQQKNKELVKRDGDFLARVQNDMQRSKEVRSRLDEKVYGTTCTFTPRIKTRPGVTSKIHKM